jgi:hypothetical protein
MSSNQRPDTLMQGRIIQIEEIFLHRTAEPYILGHNRRPGRFRSRPLSLPDLTRSRTWRHVGALP